MRKYNCTPNSHKDKLIQVIISPKGALANYNNTLGKLQLDKNLSLNSHMHQNYMFKLFPVLLIYKTFNTYSSVKEKHKIILVDK